METVKLVNSRNPHVSALALGLLDMLVKNCGYPFQLQIATKEFLNELVKRFPERPPVFLSAYQTKVLELIHEWKQTICVTSKHKDDLVHIRDMHRLLTYKGYRFPNIDSRVAAVLNPSNVRALFRHFACFDAADPLQNLKTPDELEEEDREAQSAKLQELIRRGRPQDLAQAQELMKVLSGANPEAQPDYRAQTSGELDKIQSKAVLLNDMLDQARPDEKLVEDDAYAQVATQLRRVQPRLQQWIADEEAEEGDDDMLNRLLLINDTLNQVLARHKAFRAGDFSATATLDQSIDPARNGKNAVPTARIQDLISFDDDDEPAPGQGIALPTQAPALAAAPAPVQAAAPTSLLGDDFASLQFSSTPAAPAPAAPLQPLVPQPAGASLLDGLDTLAPTPAPSTAAPASQPAHATAPAHVPAAPKDPFADLDAMFK